MEVDLRKYELLLKLFLVLLAVICTWFGACSYLNKKTGLPDNNPIEETLEVYIEDQTGLEIDLSDTPE